MPLHVIKCYMHPYCRGLQMFASLQDAWTPLKVVGAVAVINLAGDYWLIIQKGLGAVGAGITCPVAQYFGAIVFMVYLHRMGKREKGIRLSWQVSVTAQYFYFLGTSPKHERQASTQASLLNILAVPDTTMSILAILARYSVSSELYEPAVVCQYCLPGTPQSVSIYVQKQSFTVCCHKAKISSKLPNVSRVHLCLSSISRP